MSNDAIHGDAQSHVDDTIHWQEGIETVVRPALAVLYRLAIGPHADRYAPRFLAFEGGRGRPGGRARTERHRGPVRELRPSDRLLRRRMTSGER